jgi:hypothetical protein
VVRSTGLAIHHTSKAVHRLLIFGMGMLVVSSCLLAGIAWRLAQGPMQLGWLADRVRAALVEDRAPLRVSFDGVFLVWEGFQKGVDHPIDLRLTGVTVTDAAGRALATAPSAHLTISLAGLMLGRIVPRDIEVDHAQIAVTREAGGTIHWDPAEGDLARRGSIDLEPLREQLSRPASSDYGRSRGLLDQIHRVHLRDSEVTFRDRDTGLLMRTMAMDLNLVRAGAGRLRGSLRALLSVGDQRADLTAEADWTVGSGGNLNINLSSLRPSSLTTLTPALKFMAGVDLPLSLAARIEFDTSFRPKQLRADILAGEGHIRIAQGGVPVRSGNLTLFATSDAITVTQGHFDVAHTPGGSPEIVDIGGTVRREAERLSASVTVGLNQINIADLPRLWPLGVGGGARPWVTEHVTAGVVTRGTASFTIEADDQLRDVELTKATGDLEGSGATFTWIDNVPPVQQTDFHLHLVDPDTLNIQVSSAHQRVRNGGADLLIENGQVRITGLSLRDQLAVIHTQVEGSVASTLALLKEPRLHLLSTHPIALKIGEGDVSATLDFQFPLEEKLQIDDVQIQANAHLKRVRVLDVAGGQDLDEGAFDLGINKHGLAVRGQGSVATVPVTLSGSMDFGPGADDQIVQKIAITSQPTVAQVVAAGFHVADLLSGPIPLTVVIIERRDGDGSIVISSDLTLTTLSVQPLDWRKPSGDVANASATLLMTHDRLTKIDQIVVRGETLLLTGAATVDGGHFRDIVLDTIRLGQTRGHGAVQIAPNEPIRVVLRGEQIDLSAKLSEPAHDGGSIDSGEATSPNWTLDARFDRAILANGESARNISVAATGSGQMIHLLDLSGTMARSAEFAIKIDPRGSKRHLLVETRDAGDLLRAMDVIRTLRSGHLRIDGILDGRLGLHPMAGTATIDDVVVRNSPALAKLLQAITLYGLVDVLRGPGMSFSHVIVPFHYDGRDLGVDSAHAFNASLGLTANGRIEASSGQISMTGTIVPAYFFNSMLGRLPLVGKLFSPEKGGGVFAAQFGLRGPINDPIVSINPISALTPGFLREVFGIFDRSGGTKDGPVGERKLGPDSR